MDIFGCWCITIGTLTGPWHVFSHSVIPGWGGRYRYRSGHGGWSIINMLTGRTKRIGPVRMRGMNYFDRAREVARQRNEQFLKEHEQELPKYLGIHPEFDKTITQTLGALRGQ